MSAIIDAEAAPPGIAVTVRVAETCPAPSVAPRTSIGQLAAAGSEAVQPFAAIEKSLPA